METETNIERCWLILIVCPCPNCNYPSITMLLPGFEPSERFIDNEAANGLLKRVCRAPFVVPDSV